MLETKYCATCDTDHEYCVKCGRPCEEDLDLCECDPNTLVLIAEGLTIETQPYKSMKEAWQAFESAIETMLYFDDDLFETTHIEDARIYLFGMDREERLERMTEYKRQGIWEREEPEEDPERYIDDAFKAQDWRSLRNLIDDPEVMDYDGDMWENVVGYMPADEQEQIETWYEQGKWRVLPQKIYSPTTQEYLTPLHYQHLIVKGDNGMKSISGMKNGEKELIYLGSGAGADQFLSRIGNRVVIRQDEIRGNLTFYSVVRST